MGKYRKRRMQPRWLCSVRWQLCWNRITHCMLFRICSLTARLVAESRAGVRYDPLITRSA